MNKQEPSGSKTAPPRHEPLSQLLHRLLDQPDNQTPLSINSLLSRTEGRGVFLLIITICLPFLMPTPFLGLSTPMGLIMITLAVRHALALPPRVWKRIGDRPLPPRFKRTIMGRGVKLLTRLERWVKPRSDRWLSTRLAVGLNCCIIAILAFLLCLPLPPIIPFTNCVPAVAIILICLSMMEEDGVLIWLGYVAVLGNIVFFSILALSIGAVFTYWREIWEMVQSKL